MKAERFRGKIGIGNPAGRLFARWVFRVYCPARSRYNRVIVFFAERSPYAGQPVAFHNQQR
jgi:hypothetical protein